MNIDAAVRELYQVPLGQFVAERKRLAKELAKPDAKALLARRRPTISAWVVNQLWWHARDAFDRMMETADELRKGRGDADKPHREAIAKLRARAATILKDAGHAASEGVLRRVTTTLSAIAAAGGWEPSEPGALADDLDPPGFGAVGIALSPAPPAPKPHREHHPPPTETSKGDHAAESKRQKLDDQLVKAREQADGIDEKATAAREQADELEAQAARARDQAEQIASQLANAREHAERIANQVAKAREHAEQLDEQVAKARGHVADLERARRELD